MKVVVLDEVRRRHPSLAEMLERERHSHVLCRGSAEFMEEIARGLPDRVLVDVRSWGRGTSIYKYFELGRKLEEVPIVFYNAPEGFVTIAGRRRHGQDRVVSGTSEAARVAEALE